MLGSIKSTFIALILKVTTHTSFSDFRSIFLCNIIYKIISKFIIEEIKGTLSTHIFRENFGFLHCRSIHYAISIAQGCIHSIQTKYLEVVVMNIDLQRAYDCVV